MIDRHNVAKHPAGVENTAHSGEQRIIPKGSNVLPLGLLLSRRQAIYQRDVLKGTGMTQAVVTQLCMLDYALRVRKLLAISITELLLDDAYQHWRMKRSQLFDIFGELYRDGVVVKRTRRAKKGTALVNVWSLSATGRRMLDKYYGYLAGEYDHLL